MSDRSDTRGFTTLRSDKRGNASIALALVLATLLVVSAITVGMQPSTYSGGASTAPQDDVQVVEDGVQDALTNETGGDLGGTLNDTE